GQHQVPGALQRGGLCVRSCFRPAHRAPRRRRAILAFGAGTLRLFILDEENRIVPVETFLEWARWFESAGLKRRQVARSRTGMHWVSTVFLGLDHNFGDRGPP